LNENDIEFRYREYTEEPLSQAEITTVLGLMEMTPHQVLRKNDKAYKELGLTGNESAAKLISLMADHPTLLQRPIGVLGNRAALGRPPENLLALTR
jgi:arsenate reductase